MNFEFEPRGSQAVLHTSKPSSVLQRRGSCHGPAENKSEDLL